MDTQASITPNAFDVPTFCHRNAIGINTAYKAAKAGFLTLSKLFGKTVVTVEAEAEFRELLKTGKLQWPPEMHTRKPGPNERAAKRKLARLGRSPLRETEHAA